MAAPARKYNPGFLTDDELVSSFCVRTTEFEMFVENLRECTGASNPHQIVIGPRGSGKTSLLLRVAAEARRDATLAARCFPIVFPEESYEVATAGEFWLECLTHLAVQAAPYREDEPDLDRTVGELRAVRDDRILGDRCLGALLDFADRRGQRLLLLVENLNMLFRDMADRDAGWRLRKVLQTEPRIILFASATSRFAEIDNPDRALYDLFVVRTLRPLDTDQCAVLWEAVAGRPAARETVRSLEILTGGSPRLIAIVARFGAGRSFRELMADLLDLVDDHTEYFKSHLESLPAQERRVYLALAALWKPAAAREVAEHARLDPSQCSAQLARLGERGVVQVAGGSARRKRYYLTERLYNIYYLLRRRRGPDPLVEALVRFMEAYYSPRELMDFSTRMVSEISRLDPGTKALQQIALTRLMELPALAGHRAELMAMIPMELRSVAPAARAAKELFKTKIAMRNSERTHEDTLAACEEMVLRFGKSEDPAIQEWVAKALVNKGVALHTLQRPDDAVAACDEVMDRFGTSEMPILQEAVARALVNKGFAFNALQRQDDALAAFDEVVRRFGTSETPDLQESVAQALVGKGIAFDALQRQDDALAAFDEVVRRFGTSETPDLQESVAQALVGKGIAFDALQRQDDALAAFDEVVRRFGTSKTPDLQESVARALVNKGVALHTLQRPDDAVAACDEVMDRFGTSEMPILQKAVARALVRKGFAFNALQRPGDALAAFDEVVRRFGTSETPDLQESVAQALVRKGIAFDALQRQDDALAAFDEVVRRFGTSETPDLQESVAQALVRKGFAFNALQRPGDALAAFDEVVRRFGTSETPDLQESVAQALVGKGIAFDALQRQDDALAAFDEVVRRFGTSKTLVLQVIGAAALVGKGDAFLRLQRPDDALAAFDELVRRFGTSETPDLQKIVVQALAKAALAEGNESVREEHVRAMLKILAKLGSLPKDVLATLMDVSVKLGLERMRELIAGSRSATLLQPLVVALEQELGIESRVAREVEEVARDIRKDLARRRRRG